MSNMTQREMFEKSFQRPKSFYSLPESQQWDIDSNLGILDWDGDNLSALDIKRYREYFDIE